MEWPRRAEGRGRGWATTTRDDRDGEGEGSAKDEDERTVLDGEHGRGTAARTGGAASTSNQASSTPAKGAKKRKREKGEKGERRKAKQSGDESDTLPRPHPPPLIPHNRARLPSLDGRARPPRPLFSSPGSRITRTRTRPRVDA